MKIGIVSPSAGYMMKFPRRVDRGIKWLRSRGVEPVFGIHAFENRSYYSSNAENRVEDIHSFLDCDVDIIMASIGGYISVHLLPLLDYNKISKAGKTFCGYSDISAILLALATRSGAKCVYGPTFLAEICEYPKPYDDTIKYLNLILHGKDICYTQPAMTVKEFIPWENEETGICRMKEMKLNTSWEVLRRGKAHGPIWGGNLQTLLLIIGTDYFPLSTLYNAIFFFEDIEENPAIIDAMLYSLYLRGVFDTISGLIVGRFKTNTLSNHVFQLLSKLVKKADIPILCNVDIGHVQPMLSIPLGAYTILDTENDIRWECYAH